MVVFFWGGSLSAKVKKRNDKFLVMFSDKKILRTRLKEEGEI